MNQRENSLTRSKNYKISKIGLLENDKKLIIKKLGLNNLSYSYLPKVKEKKNIYSKTVSNLNNQKRNSKESRLTQDKKKNINFSHKKLITSSPMIKINNNPNATFSSNEILNSYNKYKKSLNHNKITLKKNLINNKINNNSKSYSKLPVKPLINKKIMTKTSLNKKHKKLIKDLRNNNHINSLKINQTYNNETFKNKIKHPKKDSPVIYSEIKLIKKIKIISEGKKSQNKIKISKSIPNLLFEFKNLKKEKKEKSVKIINDNILIKNINDENTESKYLSKIGQISPIKKCKICLNKIKKEKNELSKSRSNVNVIKINIIKKRNKSMQDSKVKAISSYLQNINKYVKHNDNENKIKKDGQLLTKISESNDNSEDTKKESGLNLHKLFGDKVLNNIDNNNIINEIISYNMKLNLNDNKNNKNIHSPNINDINNITESFNGENSSINHDNKYNDKKRHMSYFNNLNKNNDEENYSTKNENFSSENENNDNKNYSKRSSKIITNLQDVQKNNDKNSGQTTSTNEKKITKDMNQQQPSYSSSQIKIRNEISFRRKNNMPNKLYRFIEDIINENKNTCLIDISKILRLNDLSIFKLLSYSYDNYSSIISSIKLLKAKIYISLVHIFQHVIDDFKLKYGTFLKVLKFSFMPKVVYIKGDVSHLFNLVIECQIITKDVKKSFEIGCDYISYKKKYDNKWKFDVHKKEDIKLWLCTELDKVDNISKKFTYTSQVPSFSYQDIIKLQLNIFSKGNSIEPQSIEWSEPIISNTKPEVYQYSNYITPITYDQFRACEVETQILFWKKNLPEDDGGIVHEFEKIFKKFFEIKSISYDISKFYFFKIETIASKTGLIKQNKFSTFDINIIEYKDNIKNEIQCIYLMNSNFYSKTMDIRLGSYVTFYIIDMKR